MSMIGCYRRVTLPELNGLLRDHSKILPFFYPEDEADFPEDRSLDIDKAWEGIQFILTGDVMGDKAKPPLSYAVLGGTPLGDVDLSYGPARYLLPPQVRELAGALEAIPEAEFVKRFDMAALARAGIYGGNWEDEQEELGYFLAHYAALRDFVREAARAGDALLLWIS